MADQAKIATESLKAVLDKAVYTFDGAVKVTVFHDMKALLGTLAVSGFLYTLAVGRDLSRQMIQEC